MNAYAHFSFRMEFEYIPDPETLAALIEEAVKLRLTVRQAGLRAGGKGYVAEVFTDISDRRNPREVLAAYEKLLDFAERRGAQAA